MRKKKKFPAVTNAMKTEQRRKFLRKLGMGIIMASAYSVISVTPFGCVHDPVDELVPRGGY